VQTSLQQQARFDKFLEVFNNERPHEALGMKCPTEIYQPSTRPYTELPDIDYPLDDQTIVVTRCGRICLGRPARSLPAKPSASKKFTTIFGWSATAVKLVDT
jgi:hypothetical protein